MMMINYDDYNEDEPALVEIKLFLPIFLDPEFWVPCQVMLTRQQLETTLPTERDGEMAIIRDYRLHQKSEN